MKEIKAILQPETLDATIHALQAIPGLPGMTVSHVEGFGKIHHGAAGAAGEDAHHALHPFDERAKLEVVIPDHLLEPVLQAIRSTAHVGRPGAGKVFVYDVSDVLNLRTGERGEKAI